MDGSENSRVALEHALSLAEKYDSRIHVLYVVNATSSDLGATGETTSVTPVALPSDVVPP